MLFLRLFAVTTSESGTYLACLRMHHDQTHYKVDNSTAIVSLDWDAVAKKENIEGSALSCQFFKFGISNASFSRRSLSKFMVKRWVKRSLAPGSRVVEKNLDQSGLREDLNKQGFQVVGYGCTTCIRNSGDLDKSVAAAIEGTENEAHHVILMSLPEKKVHTAHPTVKRAVKLHF
ncbi:unnamed protein product [Eruca vesicaria subsp. sativa]|uniref:Aconitase/3-isopropylmalate dehydratase large subunit alpha/beta/alpha domain-containing protein n=1 Tax=Eruca vesicaria subsp. sativa TaxID=29727 RepID=A0ABC8LAA1_ERUVS|nr:unnamed protein product [Eruca vesicaria subsp. sativa]